MVAAAGRPEGTPSEHAVETDFSTPEDADVSAEPADADEDDA